MKRALLILVVSMFVLGLLVSAISCTKTVYITATPTPTPALSPTPSPTPTPYVLYPNRPDKQPNDVELKMDYSSSYQFNTGLWIRLYAPFQSQKPGNYTASVGKLFFGFNVEVKNLSGQPLSFHFPAEFKIRTPIDSVESPFVREYLTELPKDVPYFFLSPGQGFSGTLQPGELLKGMLEFEAVNMRGTYYVVYDYYWPTNGKRLIWGFVHDGLSD